jgi:hypothetical protein
VRGLALTAVLVAAVLTGCAAGPTGGRASTAPAAAPATSGATPTTGPRVQQAPGAVERVETGGGVPFLARDGLVWGAAPALLWAVEEKTGEVVRRIPVPDSIEVISLGLGGDSIWVGIRHPGRVRALLQLDARTGQVRGDCGTSPSRPASRSGSDRSGDRLRQPFPLPRRGLTPIGMIRCGEVNKQSPGLRCHVESGDLELVRAVGVHRPDLGAAAGEPAPAVEEDLLAVR